MSDTKLKAYIDRVLRSREREDAEKANTKAIYAELNSDGYDKAIVGKVVNHLRKDQDKVREQSDLFDTYLIAYLGASHVHARARDTENEDHPGGENANSVGKADASHASLRSGREAASRLAHNQEIAGSSPAPATTSTVPQHNAEEAGEGTTAASSLADIPEPETGASSSPSVSEAGGESAIPAAALAVPSADRSKPHPWCKDPEDCGVEASWDHMCLSCHRRMEKALTERPSSVLQ